MSSSKCPPKPAHTPITNYIRIDPEYAKLPTYPKTDVSKDTLAQQRQYEDNNDTYPGVTRTRMTVPATNGEPEVAVDIFTPTEECNKPRPVLFDIHGGGYVMGNLLWDRELCSKIAREVNCIVVATDYRWAPENPYPAALNDVFRALEWTYDNADKIGIDRSRIAIGGSSAGGGLAAALALKIRDEEHKIKPIFQLLIFPMLDDRTNLETERRPEVGKYVWNLAENTFGWESYLGTNYSIGDPNVPYYLAPARATSLASLPPAHITVGELDLFRDEDVAYAQQFWKDGVSCSLDIVPGVYHSFMTWPGTQATNNFYKRVEQVLRRAFYVTVVDN